jgi:hypothetical protein
MKKQILKELNDIKYLFNYNRGKIISEQEQFDDEEEFVDYDDIDYGDMDDDMDDDEEEYYPELRIPHDMPSYKTKYRHSDDDMELDEEMDLPVMLPGTKEKERTKVTPGTKPGKKPDTPYNPKPGPKPDPKARKRKGDMPTWLTFDELGIDFE